MHAPACVADLRELARRRLPRLVFDYLDRGAEDGMAMQRNRAAFERVLFMPRVLRDVANIDPSVQVLGRRQTLPFIVGPTGLNGLYWPHAEEALARVASDAGVPFALSTASNSLIEDVRAAAGDGALWLQLYVHEDRRIAEDLMRRAAAAGFAALLLTVDVAVHGRRDHDIRNGFRMPLAPTPRLLADLLRHPRWCWRMLRQGGAPQFVNIARSAGVPLDLARQAASLGRALDRRLDWSAIGWLRDYWHGPLVLKGLLSPEDAELACRHGLDAIVLSNHGGRQLDSVPSALQMLPDVAAAVGDRLELLVDGGVRRGDDAAKALALGARAVLLGRAPLYGLAACGPDGAAAVLELLADEYRTALTLLGCAAADRLDSSYLTADHRQRLQQA